MLKSRRPLRIYARIGHDAPKKSTARSEPSKTYRYSGFPTAKIHLAHSKSQSLASEEDEEEEEEECSRELEKEREREIERLGSPESRRA